MTQDENIAVIEASAAALNAHDVPRFLGTLHDDVEWTIDATKGPVEGKEAMGKLIEAMFEALPDAKFNLIRNWATDDDHVVTRYTLTGTHRGSFFGNPPSEKPIEMHGCIVSEIKDNKRYRMWQYASGPGLMELLGGS